MAHHTEQTVHHFHDEDLDMIATFFEGNGRIEIDNVHKEYYWSRELEPLLDFLKEVLKFVKAKEKENAEIEEEGKPGKPERSRPN